MSDTWIEIDETLGKSPLVIQPSDLPAINLATSGSGGVTGTLPFLNMQAGQAVVGISSNTISAAASSASYIPFTQGPTLAFAPLVTGNYLLMTQVIVGGGAGASSVKIATSAAGVVPTALYEAETTFSLVGTSAAATCFGLYSLTQSQNYRFQMYGKNVLGNAVILHNQLASSGTNMIALQMS